MICFIVKTERRKKEVGKQVGIRNYEQRKKEIQGMNLTSDLLSSVTFEDRLAAQDVLRILTGMEDLTVVRVEPQRSFRNLYGHSSVSDVWAEDLKRNKDFTIQILQNVVYYNKR